MKNSNEYTKIKLENIKLKNKIKKLREDLIFMNNIFKNENTLLCHLKRKTINNKHVWINIQTCSVNDLEKLDQDEEIKKWIDEKKITQYDDYSWYR
jgi:hypothetical protein